MNCKKCNSPLEEGALFCSSCGDRFAVNDQKEKVNETFANTKNLILKQTKSPIFLTVAILFSVIFASQVISMLTGGIFGIISGLIPFIFMLITVIGLWTSFAAKDASALGKSLRQASIFDAYTRVMHSISIVLLSIIGVVAFVITLMAGLFGGGLASEMGSAEASDALFGVAIVAAIVILVVFAIIITIVSIFKGIYARRRKYFVALAETAQTCNYTAIKAPVIGSYILGGFDVLSAIFPMVIAISGSALINGMFGTVLAELGLQETINALLSALTSSLAISGISSLISGGYLILSALWISMVHKAQLANKAAVMAECALLEQIENATREAIFEEERRKQEPEVVEADEPQEEPAVEETAEEIPVVEEVTVEEAVGELVAEEATETVE